MKFICSIFLFFLNTVLFSVVFGSTVPKKATNLNKAKEFLLYSKYDSAIYYFKKALFDLQFENNITGEVSCLNRLGEINYLIGNNSRALEYLDQCRTIILKYPNNKNELLAECYDLTGAVYESWSDIEEALFYYNESLKIRKDMYGENDARTAFSYRNIASYYNFKIVKDSAFFFAAKALNICNNFPEHTMDIKLELIYSEYAYDYKIYKREAPSDFIRTYDTVRCFLDTALNIVRKKYPSPNYYEASILHSLGNTYTDCTSWYKEGDKRIYRDFLHAKSYYEKDINIYKNIFGNHHSKVSTTYFTLGILHLYAFRYSDIATGLKYYQKAIISLVPSFNNVDFLIPPLIELCINNYDLMVILSAKSYELSALYSNTNKFVYLKALNDNNKVRIMLWDKIMQSFKSRETNLVIQIWNHSPFEEAAKSAFQMFQNTRDSTYLNDIYFYSEKAKNSELQKSLFQFSKKLTNKLIDGSNNIKSEFTDVISIKELQNNILDKRTALIEYFAMPNSAWDFGFLILITSSQFIVFKLEETSEIEKLIFKARDEMKNNRVELFAESSALLYERILQPAVDKLDSSIRNLIIIPHRNYCYIPFDALITENVYAKDFKVLPYLMKKYAIKYDLSATMIKMAKYFPNSTSNTIAGFAPKFTNLSALPFSSALLKKISDKVAGSYFFESQATTATFSQSAKNHSVIHLATHSVADVDQPENAKIYFSATLNDSLSNDYITIDEISSAKLNADLAVISACETTIGKDSYGEGLKSFARAFTYAGCKSTITTLWKVDDKSTSLILEKFYDYLISGNLKSDALHKAKLDFLFNCKSSDEANPFNWSGVILTGDTNSLRLNEKKTLHIGYVITAVIIIIGIVLKGKIKRRL